MKRITLVILSLCTTDASAFTLLQQTQLQQPLKVVQTASSSTIISNKCSSSSSLNAFRTHGNNDRRSFLNTIQGTITSITLGTVTSTVMTPTQPAHSTLMDTSMDKAKTFKLGEKLSIEEAKNRLKDAIVEIDELIDNYSDISKGGGDAVRRYLGTVGVEKKMYGITKVVKGLREEADDIVEYTELANEFEAYLYQAEGAAYQSLFVEHSSAKGTPESFLATAKKDVMNMRKYMGDLAEQLKL